MEKYFLGVYNDKSNVNQALESNYLECNCLYSQKKNWFWKTLWKLKGSAEKLGRQTRHRWDF